MATTLKNRDLEQESLRLSTLDVRDIWVGFWREHFAFWMICGYLFVEYVRPQSILPQIDVLPWGKLFLALAIIGAVLDRSVRWVSDPNNGLISLFLAGIVVSISVANYPEIGRAHV